MKTEFQKSQEALAKQALDAWVSSYTEYAPGSGGPARPDQPQNSEAQAIADSASKTLRNAWAARNNDSEEGDDAYEPPPPAQTPNTTAAPVANAEQRELASRALAAWNPGPAPAPQQQQVVPSEAQVIADNASAQIRDYWGGSQAPAPSAPPPEDQVVADDAMRQVREAFGPAPDMSDLAPATGQDIIDDSFRRSRGTLSGMPGQLPMRGR